jgi:tetratricopeptide (TPR) repeat protein
MMIFVVHICKSQQAQRDTIFAKKLLHKADSLNRNGNYKTSDKIALEAASIFKESEKWALWFEVYNIIFYNGLDSKDLDISIQLIKKGLPALPTSETYLLGRLHYILGYCHERKGLIFEALPYYEQSLENFKKVKDNYFINQIYGNICQIYIQKGEYQKAITYLKNAIAHGKSNNDTLTIWKNTKSLGGAYLYNGELQKARKTYKRAQQLIDEKDGTFERYEA